MQLLLGAWVCLYDRVSWPLGTQHWALNTLYFVQDSSGQIENEELSGFLKDLLELVKNVGGDRIKILISISPRYSGLRLLWFGRLRQDDNEGLWHQQRRKSLQKGLLTSRYQIKVISALSRNSQSSSWHSLINDFCSKHDISKIMLLLNLINNVHFIGCFLFVFF